MFRTMKLFWRRPSPLALPDRDYLALMDAADILLAQGYDSLSQRLRDLAKRLDHEKLQGKTPR